MLIAPKMQYCFANAETGMTTFDPFQFMVRKAYADGTDLRLFTTPLHAVVRATIDALGLREHYAYWLKELVRINEEEASKAGRQPFPLWDFSMPNSVTTEPIPELGDRSPMRWFWEWSHYRKQTGDLILDRVFDSSDPERIVPADFGVRLTRASIDAHLASAATRLANWTAQSGLASRIAREVGQAEQIQPAGRSYLPVSNPCLMRPPTSPAGSISGGDASKRQKRARCSVIRGT